MLKSVIIYIVHALYMCEPRMGILSNFRKKINNKRNSLKKTDLTHADLWGINIYMVHSEKTNQKLEKKKLFFELRKKQLISTPLVLTI